MIRTRCAIYTRKSSEEGLEQEFNSLHAQREACAAYVASQKHEGWVLVPDAYDDGGLSGGTLERPALQRLLAEVKAGRVDRIVVYKIDRLTRSLSDFARIVDVLDGAGASFVSVTQSFNTATSMGRLTLNMLLSFAQFEREVTAERIRDKIAASKRKGLWMGGNVPFGYDVEGRTLRIREDEVATVRTLYRLYEELGTVRAVKEEAERLGLRTRLRRKADGTTTGGRAFDRGHIHHLLTNPLYAGRIRHRDRTHPGQHPAIIPAEQWERVQGMLRDGAARDRRGRGNASATFPSLLGGKLFDGTGDRLTPSHSRTRAGARLRYYVSHRLMTEPGVPHPDAWRLPAPELEDRVTALVREWLTRPGLAATLLLKGTSEEMQVLAEKLDSLRTADATDLLELIERIDLAPGTLAIRLDGAALADRLSVESERIDPAHLVSGHPFTLRKRGVETKLVLGEMVHSRRDETLLRNVAQAHRWFERIRGGATISDIARAAGTSNRHVQRMIGLAFLAPDIVQSIVEGTQPIGLTSEWCKTHDLPAEWDAQRAMIAAL